MKKELRFMTLPVAMGAFFMLSGTALAADRVVIVPIGGTAGNATAADVVKGKTFSSKAAGKGVSGTLVQHPMGQSFTNTIGMTFNLLPAGTFTMGSESTEPGRAFNETQHQVTLTQSFYMQTTEVTNKQWNDIIVTPTLGVNPSPRHTDDNYPVENVNWFEAAYFANRLSVAEGKSQCYTLTDCNDKDPGTGMECSSVEISNTCTGYRLPTEAQWEYAARAGTTTAFANPVYFDSTNTEMGAEFNSNLHAMGWYSYNDTMYNNTSGGGPSYGFGTKPVAAKQPNRWGLYDMHGNVLEWCRDWWDRNDYLSDSVTDPTGDVTGSLRVVRGGCWGFGAVNARSAFRDGKSPDVRGLLGFRLALPPGQ